MNARPEDDWYLREWMRHLRKKQASLVADLGWTRGRASKVFNGSLPYRREVLNQVAGWLGIKPYELLMKPEEAIALRRLRETAKIIAQESD